jgi:polar amino acid transport system substrate-binding protein
MKSFKELLRKFSLNGWLSRKPILIGLALVVILGIWGIFKACSHPAIRGEPAVYMIARDISWYPLQLGDKDKNVTAFTSELLLDIANEEKFSYNLDNVGSTLLFYDLDNKDYDAILASTAPTAWNKEQYEFSDPFYLVGPVLIVPIDSTIHSIAEMEGKTLGIRSGSSVVFDVATIPSIIIIPYDNINQSLDNLRDNQIDGVILPTLLAQVYVKTFYNTTLKIATPPLTNEGLRLVTRKEPRFASLISRFNNGLKKVKENGTYNELLYKWGLSNTETVDAAPSPKKEH